MVNLDIQGQFQTLDFRGAVQIAAGISAALDKVRNAVVEIGRIKGQTVCEQALFHTGVPTFTGLR